MKKVKTSVCGATWKLARQWMNTFSPTKWRIIIIKMNKIMKGENLVSEEGSIVSRSKVIVKVFLYVCAGDNRTIEAFTRFNVQKLFDKRFLKSFYRRPS